MPHNPLLRCARASALTFALACFGGVRAAEAQCFSNRVTPDVPQVGEGFGGRVDISGTRAVIAARSGDNGGRVVFVERSAARTWEQINAVSAPADPDDEYGTSVAIFGGFAAVGEPGATIGGVFNAGRVYVYRRTLFLGNPVWILDETIDNPSPQQAEFFGRAVDLTENSAGVLTLAVGVPNARVGGEPCGRVRIFVRASDGVWSQQDSVIATSPRLDAEFGHAVALQSDRLVVGAYREPVGSSLGGGAAYVYNRSGADWGTGTRLTVPEALRTGIDDFGFDIALDDNTLAIGAPKADIEGEGDAGAIYVFSRLGPGWLFRQQLTEGNPGSTSRVGDNVALADGVVVAGEIGSGRAHCWRLIDGEWTLWSPFIPPDDEPLTKGYGRDVAMDNDGSFVIVGDPLNDETGAAFVFATDYKPAFACTGGLLDPVPLVEPGVTYYGCNDFDGAPDGTACTLSARDVWYRYTAPCNGILALSTCGTDDMGSQDSGIDTVLAVYSGCPGDAGTILVCNNNAPFGNWPDACGLFGNIGEQRDSAVKLGVAAGQTYRIRVASAGSAGPGGLFRLNVDFTCCEVDWDANGTVNSTDVSAFINDWFADQQNGTLFTDFDNNGTVNSTDVSMFINAWFEGCEV